MEVLRFSPVDMPETILPPTGVFWQSWRPSKFIISTTCCLLCFSSKLVLSLQAKSKSSMGVLAAHNASSYSTNPPKFRNSSMPYLNPLAVFFDALSTHIPLLFWNLYAIKLRSVLFPAPLGPSIATISPGRANPDMSLRMTFLSTLTVTLVHSSYTYGWNSKSSFIIYKY